MAVRDSVSLLERHLARDVRLGAASIRRCDGRCKRGLREACGDLSVARVVMPLRLRWISARLQAAVPRQGSAFALPTGISFAALTSRKAVLADRWLNTPELQADVT